MGGGGLRLSVGKERQHVNRFFMRSMWRGTWKLNPMGNCSLFSKHLWNTEKSNPYISSFNCHGNHNSSRTINKWQKSPGAKAAWWLTVLLCDGCSALPLPLGVGHWLLWGKGSCRKEMKMEGANESYGNQRKIAFMTFFFLQLEMLLHSLRNQ